MSVFQSLKERRTEIDDESLVTFVDEALENQEVFGSEDDEPTLKHGTDTVNYESILSEGLVPGSENSSVTGESGEGDDIAFSMSFPVALRYAELTEACQQGSGDHFTVPSGGYGSIEDPMVVEIPVSDIGEVSIDSRNGTSFESILGVDPNPRVGSVITSYLEGDEDFDWSGFYEGKDHLIAQAVLDGDEEAGEVVKGLLGGTYGNTGTLLNEDVFGNLSYDEVNGDFLQEVNTPYASVNGGATVYVPGEKIDEYRDMASEEGFEGDVHSLEARALVHEERMKDVYQEDGKVKFLHPGDTGNAVNMFETDTAEYDNSPDVVDVSRLRGESLYDQGSNL